MAKKKKKTKKSTATKKTAKKKVTAKKSKTTKKKATKKVAKKVVKKKTAKKVAKKVSKKVLKKTSKKVTKKTPSLVSKISKKVKDVGKKISGKVTTKPAKPVKKVEKVKDSKPKTPKKKVATLIMGKQLDDADSAEHEVFSPEDMVFFKDLLQAEKQKILKKAKEILSSGNMELDRNEMSDEVDLASATIEQNLQFRLLDRDRKLLNLIEHAISKIETGDFGYCEGTGEIIPKRRLELSPWTRHSVKFKEQLEKMKKSGRGVADDESEELS